MKYVVFYFLLSTLSNVLSAQVLSLAGGEAAAPSPAWESRQTWTTVPDLDGRFSISIPAAAWQQRVDSVTTPVGTLAYHTFSLQPPVDSADNAVYQLAYVDYPPATLHHDSSELVQEFFFATREAAVERMKGELRFATDRTLQFAYPGSYWRIDYRQGQASVRTQAFVVGRRYYALQTMSKSTTGINRSTDRFFDGFTVFAPAN